eukprot:TRINITY_DN3421_c0_g1_i1.p1 TRINITY_DN3421_c0_g1~~TRINITY_DN3421_c0_g1_i1.p1  ORF type:complete len:200 (-),score=80.71 TRINITY_DN3421_c0_g1_i1:315-914(-)
MSDYKDEIVENIERNVALNVDQDTGMSDCESAAPAVLLPRRPALRNLDWQSVAADPTLLTDADRVDIVIGSDLVYGLHLADWLPIVIDRLLKPDGYFFAVMPKNRWGITEFVKNLEALGFNCTVGSTPDNLSDDFAKKSCWDLFICSRMFVVPAIVDFGAKAVNDNGVLDMTDHFTEQADWDMFRDLYKKKTHSQPRDC